MEETEKNTNTFQFFDEQGGIVTVRKTESSSIMKNSFDVEKNANGTCIANVISEQYMVMAADSHNMIICDGGIHVCDPKGKINTIVSRNHEALVSAAATSKGMFAYAVEKNVCVFILQPTMMVTKQFNFAHSITALAVCPDRAHILVGVGNSVQLYKISSYDLKLVDEICLSYTESTRECKIISVVAVTEKWETDRMVCAANEDGNIVRFSMSLKDAAQFQLFRPMEQDAYENEQTKAMAMAVSPDGNQIYAAFCNKKKIYKIDTHNEVQEHGLLHDKLPVTVNYIQISNDGSKLMVNGRGGDGLFTTVLLPSSVAESALYKLL